MSLLDRTQLTEEEKVDVLTDGCHDSYQTPLLMNTITTTEDWLQKALRIEVALSRQIKVKEKASDNSSNCVIKHCDESNKDNSSDSSTKPNQNFNKGFNKGFNNGKKKFLRKP